MGFWSAITGRSKPKQADLDSLFAVPSAAITLQTALGFHPTGQGSVCYRAAAGPGFDRAQQEMVDLLGADPDVPTPTVDVDDFGFSWLNVDRSADDVHGLCTDLHAVNTTLEVNGYGPGLLCSLVPFADRTGRKVGLVYLYKQGTFYPFAPNGPQQRDNLLELNVRDTLTGELPMEEKLSSWMALWGAPGL